MSDTEQNSLLPESARDIPVVIQQRRQPTILEQMTARLRRPTGGDDRTPMEMARDDYNQLREDNMHLIDEVSSLTVERDVLQRSLDDTRAEKAALQEKYDTCSRRLGSMVQSLRTAGNSILSVIKDAEAAASGDAGVLEQYRPSGMGEKIVTK